MHYLYKSSYLLDYYTQVISHTNPVKQVVHEGYVPTIYYRKSCVFCLFVLRQILSTPFVTQ